MEGQHLHGMHHSTKDAIEAYAKRELVTPSAEGVTIPQMALIIDSAKCSLIRENEIIDSLYQKVSDLGGRFQVNDGSVKGEDRPEPYSVTEILVDINAKRCGQVRRLEDLLTALSTLV